MLSLETGKILDIIYQDNKIQILNIEIDSRDITEEGINYIEETGICNVSDLVVLNTIGNRLGLGTGGYNFIYLNLSKKNVGKEIYDRNQGHIIKMKYTPGQIRIKAVEENNEIRYIFDNEQQLLRRPVIYTILHSMIYPLAAAIKYFSPNSIVSCVYIYGGAMNSNNSFILKKIKELGLINNVITAGECYGGDYESINITTGMLFAFNQLHSDIVIVCCGPGVAGSSTFYGFSTFDFIGPIYIAKLLGLQPILVPRISMADKRERHRGISMQSLAILKTLDFAVSFPVYKDNEDTEGFSYIYSQLIVNDIINKHNVQFIDNPIVKKINYLLNADARVMGRSYIEDPWFFNSCGSVGIYSAMLLKK